MPMALVSLNTFIYIKTSRLFQCFENIILHWCAFLSVFWCGIRTSAIFLEFYTSSYDSSLQQIQLSYSKPLSIVTMELKAQHGYLYPSEKMSQNWEDIKAINPSFDGSNYTLTFSGLANSINKALRAFMYQG